MEDEENNFEEENDENEKKAACPWGASKLFLKLKFSSRIRIQIEMFFHVKSEDK